MLIQIDKLKRQPRQINIDEQAASFPVLKALVEEETLFFNEKITGFCEAMRADDVIEVTGRLTTKVTSPCCRCLAPVVSLLDIEIDLSYVGEEVTEAPDVEEIEIQNEELGLISFSGLEIDLGPDLEQEVVMALPQQPLCHDTCKGLCPVCGCNMNLNSCSCEPSVFHAGLAVLKNFKVKQ